MPSITGIVTEVHDKYIVIQGEPNELYHLSEKYHVSLPAEYENPDTSYSVGDEVIVYYDGNIAESDPLHCMETMSFIPVHATTVSHAVGYEPGQGVYGT